MDLELSVVLASPLFCGIEEGEARSMLQCLSARTVEYGKGQTVLEAGETVSSVGLVLSGRFCVVREDYWGRRDLLAQLGPGELFAESFACVPGAPLTVSVTADAAGAVLFLDVGRVMGICPSACPFHARLLRNLLAVLARKNLGMNEKLTHMARRTTREKLLSYLSAQAARRGSARFDIPFDRQALADYLAVDRSAMSAELGKLRREGVIDFHRERFEMKTSEGPTENGGPQ